MKKRYNILLVLSYAFGAVLFAEVCVCKWLLWLTWTAQAEFVLWLVCVVVYGIHAILLAKGYKKKLLQWEVLKGIQIFDMIVFLPQIALVAFSHIFSFGSQDLQTTLSDIQYVFCVLFVQIAILVLRKVCNSFICNKMIDEALSKKTNSTGDGSI